MDDVDRMALHDSSDQGWAVCVLVSTTIEASRALQARVRARSPPVTLASDIGALPGPVSGAVYATPIAVGIPVVVRQIQWPRAGDILTRLPDAVWGTTVDGATDSSPAPGSAAAVLGR